MDAPSLPSSLHSPLRTLDVSDIETIRHELRALHAGIDQVQQAAAGASQRAREIVGQAAVLGMTGVAIGEPGAWLPGSNSASGWRSHPSTGTTAGAG